MNTSFYFNGKRAPEWIIIRPGFRLPTSQKKPMYRHESGINGAFSEAPEYENIKFTLPLTILNFTNDKTNKTPEEIKNILNDFFYTEGNSEGILQIDGYETYITCRVYGYDLDAKLIGADEIELEVESSKWYYEKVGPLKKDSYKSGYIQSNNTGISVPPIQRFKIAKDTTVLRLENQSTGKYLEFGHEVKQDEDAPTKDERVLAAYATNIFSGWPNIPTGQSLPIVGKAKGKYAFKDDVLFVETFGDRIGETEWIGPAKQTQLNQRVGNDWRIELRVITPPSVNADRGRKQFMFLDELKRVVALIEVRNNSSMHSNIEVLMTLYDGIKSQQVYYFQNANWREKGLVIKLTKRNNEYTGYVGVDLDVRTGRRYQAHAHVVIDTYVDYAAEYDRTFSFAHTQDLRAPNHSEMKFNTTYIKIDKLHEEIPTPYIFYKDDEILIDHDRNLLTINGVRNYHKSLRSDYFDLEQGENVITITPSDVIESGYQEYRERYL